MNISISALIETTWKQFKPQWLLAAGITLIFGAATVFLIRLTSFAPLITTPLGFGWIYCLNELRKGHKITVRDLGWAFMDLERYLHALLLSLLYSLGITFGLVCLVLPGVWFFVSAGFCYNYFVTTEPNSLRAIKRSIASVKGHWWKMALVCLTCWAIILFGVLCFGIGLLIAAPFVTMVYFNAAEALAEITPIPAQIME